LLQQFNWALPIIAVSLLVMPANGWADQKGATLELADGFKAELLYSAPLNKQDSWVSCTFGPDGQLYVSAERGPLYRVNVDEAAEGRVTVEPIRIRLPKKDGQGKTQPIGGAQGLCWAFDSLYVVVAKRGQALGQGLYRVWDSNADGRLDQGELLRKFHGGGDHGPHAVIPTADGEALYVMGGNRTRLPALDLSRQPRVWQEDLLLPRMTDPRGHASNLRAPGGWVCRVDPQGKRWELIGSGFRNSYDMAINRAGDLFTFDSDMEWDVNLPWYRPTRALHVTSGAEFGWRNGSGKWPTYYPDSLPPMVDAGRGSPTGVLFGYGAKFPAKYQRALFLCDWSYGRIFAAHLEPKGASYTAKIEPFLQGSPFPVADLTVGPDGAMYLITGGRHTQTWLYRVTYEGDQSTAPAASVKADAGVRRARALRRKLETLHRKDAPGAVDKAWPHLGSPHRTIRYAARLAIEHQPLKQWRGRALNETDPQALLTAMVGFARHAEPSDQPAMIDALGRLSWGQLDEKQKLALLRAYQLCFTRLGQPSDKLAQRVAGRLNPHYPAGVYRLDRELSRVLGYLHAPNFIAKTLQRMEQAPATMQQIHYAYVLRTVDQGWTLKQCKQYFQWFNEVANSQGGASFKGYLSRIKQQALKKLDSDTRKKVKPILNAKPKEQDTAQTLDRDFAKNWQMKDLLPALQGELEGRNFERGERMFAAARCFECHRFNGRGGATGPDLTSVGQRFSKRYILESILEPSEVVSDQYQATLIKKKDGSTVAGRIVNMSGNSIQVQPNPFAPSALIRVNRNQIKSTRPYDISLMPPGMISQLKKEEILDMFAYMLSGGEPDDPMFE
jgi:putative heme-binding domain-containing protein